LNTSRFNEKIDRGYCSDSIENVSKPVHELSIKKWKENKIHEKTYKGKNRDKQVWFGHLKIIAIYCAKDIIFQIKSH